MLDKVLRFITRNSSLESLNIGNNFLTSASLEKLLTILIRLKKNIRHLDLTFSSIEKPSIAKIGALLAENTSLLSLNIKGCNLSLEDIQVLNDSIV